MHRSTAARALNPATRHLISGEVVARVEGRGAAPRLPSGRARGEPAHRPLAARGRGPARHRQPGLRADPGRDRGRARANAATRRWSPTRRRTRSDQVEIVEQLIARRVDGLILATARRSDPVLTHCLDAGVPTVLVNRAEDRAPRPDGGDRRRRRDAAGGGAPGRSRPPPHRPSRGPAGSVDRPPATPGVRGGDAACRPRRLVVATAAAYTPRGRPGGRGRAPGPIRGHRRSSPPTTSWRSAPTRSSQRAACACPDDVSVVGHNDMPLVDMVHPPLTTVRIDHLAMGGEAARLVVARIEGEPEEALTRTTEPASWCGARRRPPPVRRRRATPLARSGPDGVLRLRAPCHAGRLRLRDADAARAGGRAARRSSGARAEHARAGRGAGERDRGRAR